MSNESCVLVLSLPLAQFNHLRDESTADVIECYCAFCHRLIGASRDRSVLEIERQRHMCAESSTLGMAG